MRVSAYAVVVGFSLLAAHSCLYAEDYTPVANPNDSTVDVIALNNSGQAITYVSSYSVNYSSCQIIVPNPNGPSNVVTHVIPAGGYFIVHGVDQGGNGVTCSLKFTYGNAQDLNLEIIDPNYFYGGSADYRFYLDTQQTVSVSYLPVLYPGNVPKGLMDSADTLVLNSL